MMSLTSAMLVLKSGPAGCASDNLRFSVELTCACA